LSFKADPSDPPPSSYGSTSTSEAGAPESNPSVDVEAGSQGGGQEWLDSNGVPEKMVSYDEATTEEWITPYQAKKAAWVVKRLAEYRLLLQQSVLTCSILRVLDLGLTM
jgi:carnitine O-acetyltransferase